MKRKSTAYRFTKVLLIVCVLLMLPANVWAQDTTLTTVVPSTHTLHIELIGKVTLYVDGTAYTKSEEVQLKRYSNPQISVQVANGHKVKSVLWGDTNITDALQNGEWTAPEVTEDVRLTVVLEKNGSMPPKEDTFQTGWWLLIAGVLLFGMVVYLLIYKKKKA